MRTLAMAGMADVLPTEIGPRSADARDRL